MSAPEGVAPEVWEAAGKLDSLPLNAGMWQMTILEGYRQAWIRKERERIIALLEGECFCDSVNPYQEKFCDACRYVALIKGENK
jgi:hypothetical protein